MLFQEDSCLSFQKICIHYFFILVPSLSFELCFVQHFFVFEIETDTAQSLCCQTINLSDFIKCSIILFYLVFPKLYFPQLYCNPHNTGGRRNFDGVLWRGLISCINIPRFTSQPTSLALFFGGRASAVMGSIVGQGDVKGNNPVGAKAVTQDIKGEKKKKRNMGKP